MYTYPEHLEEARKQYDSAKLSLDEFYQKGRIHLPEPSDKWMDAVNETAKQADAILSKCAKDGKGLLADFSDIFKFTEVGALADEIVPFLESDLYGCHLFVDKVYCYRSFNAERAASWLWHWDNNPDEVFKIIIYLTDVEDDQGPFEYLENDSGILRKKSTRTGHNNWKAPPNNSRVLKDEIDALKSDGAKSTRVAGKKGTTIAFNNNIIHRANPPALGKHRDIITLRVRPTLTKVEKYVDPKWTTTSYVSGAAPKDPEQKRKA